MPISKIPVERKICSISSCIAELIHRTNTMNRIYLRNFVVTIKTRTDQWMGFDMQTASPAYDDLVAVPEAIARFPYVRLSMS